MQRDSQRKRRAATEGLTCTLAFLSVVRVRLFDVGYQIGLRSLELLTYRQSIQSFLLTGSSGNVGQTPISLSNVGSLTGKKDRSVVSMLQFVHGFVWKSLFGRVADGLEKSTDKEDEYYIYDRDPITNRFISVPREMGHLNCATFIAGILGGILDGAQFTCEVSAHFNTSSSGMTRTVFVIKFDKEVSKRET